jgi:hypothetical protein
MHSFLSVTLSSLEFLSVYPMAVVTAAILLSLLVSVVRQTPWSTQAFRRYWWPVVAQFLIFLVANAISVVGFVGWRPTASAGPNTFGLRSEQALAMVSLSLCLYWIWRLEGTRWFAISLACLQLWMLAGANVIAGWAMRGRWR